MIKLFKNYFWSRCLAKYSCKFSPGVCSLGGRKQVLIENFVKLGRVAIHGNKPSIGAHSYIRSGSELYGDCEIGRFCSIGNNVIIGLEKNKHPTHWLTTSLFFKDLERLYESKMPQLPTKIGNDCWIGRDAVIMGGSRW